MSLLRHRSWLAGGSAAVLAAAGLTLAATAAPAQAAAGCQVSYTVTSQWQGGFGASVTITNLGSPITSWDLA